MVKPRYLNIFLFILIITILTCGVAKLIIMWAEKNRNNGRYQQNYQQNYPSIQNGSNNYPTGMPGAPKIVLYYSPSCSQCTKFLPQWEAFENFARSGRNLEVQKINCEENPGSCQGITVVPTIVLFKNNKSIVYDGDLTSSDLVRFVNSN